MANVVPDEIEPAECVGSLAHDVAGEVVADQVSDDPNRLAACRLDLRDNRIDTGRVEVDHRDCGTLTREPQRTCTGA
jgi:hypothetical protein